MRDLNSYSKLLSLFQLRTDPHLATWELAVKHDFFFFLRKFKRLSMALGENKEVENK